MRHEYNNSDNTWLVYVNFGPTLSMAEGRNSPYYLDYAKWKVDDKISTVVPQSETALGKCY
jgi:hypothetical protein